MGFAVGPHSWKGHRFPACQRLWNARREPGNVQVHSESPAEAPLALIGVRACELHAIAIQDRVLMEGDPFAVVESMAIAAFAAAWQRPDGFRRVFSAIGTYVGLRGGNEFPVLIRKTEPKPIRVFLQDGRNDLNN